MGHHGSHDECHCENGSGHDHSFSLHKTFSASPVRRNLFDAAHCIAAIVQLAFGTDTISCRSAVITVHCEMVI
jgi:hypothetical protein